MGSDRQPEMTSPTSELYDRWNQQVEACEVDVTESDSLQLEDGAYYRPEHAEAGT